MDRPLGRAVGNSLEVVEAVECLQGGGPPDLREVVLILADHPGAAAVLDSGAALDRFAQMVEAQGGDPESLLKPDGLRGAGVSCAVAVAEEAGVVTAVDAGGVGRAAYLLGAGRRHADDPVDPGVGVLLHVAPGDVVEPEQPLVTLYHRDGHALGEARALVEAAVVVGDTPPVIPPLIHDTVGSAS